MSSSINVARSWTTCPPCKPLSINLWRIRHSHLWKPSLDLSLSLASISMDMWMSQTSLDRKVTNSLPAWTLSWTSNLELQDVIVRQKPSWTLLTSYVPWSCLSLCSMSLIKNRSSCLRSISFCLILTALTGLHTISSTRTSSDFFLNERL